MTIVQPMRILFIHQNLPGQFRHLLLHYARQPGCQVVSLGEARRIRENFHKMPPGLDVVAYDMPPEPAAAVDPFLRSTEQAVRRGKAVATALLGLRERGFRPDVVVAHPGWGEALYVKDVFPNAQLICFGEFYYGAEGRDFGFDPEFPQGFDDRLQLRTRNMVQLLSFEAADAILSPTHWQRQALPADMQHKVTVVHDGIDTTLVRPNPASTISLVRDQLTLAPADELITFVNRNLEPYRGFHTFMRALPDLLTRRPNARVILVGGDEVSYGKRLVGKTWREHMLAELGHRLDMRRVHFVGKLPYSVYLNLLQVSTAHVYLTYPFVLSWSMLEAMAAGCLVIGSNTAPVTELLQHGHNGLLVDFFSPQDIVAQVERVCSAPDRMQALRHAAREHVVQHFDLHSVCLPKQCQLIESLCHTPIGATPANYQTVLQ